LSNPAAFFLFPPTSSTLATFRETSIVFPANFCLTVIVFVSGRTSFLMSPVVIIEAPAVDLFVNDVFATKFAPFFFPKMSPIMSCVEES